MQLQMNSAYLTLIWYFEQIKNNSFSPWHLLHRYLQSLWDLNELNFASSVHSWRGDSLFLHDTHAIIWEQFANLKSHLAWRDLQPRMTNYTEQYWGPVKNKQKEHIYFLFPSKSWGPPGIWPRLPSKDQILFVLGRQSCWNQISLQHRSVY